jgi:hypothetical protein
MKFHNKDYWAWLQCRKLHKQFMELDDEVLLAKAEDTGRLVQCMTTDTLKERQLGVSKMIVTGLITLICIEKELLNRRKQ